MSRTSDPELSYFSMISSPTCAEFSEFPRVVVRSEWSQIDPESTHNDGGQLRAPSETARETAPKLEIFGVEKS